MSTTKCRSCSSPIDANVTPCPVCGTARITRRVWRQLAVMVSSVFLLIGAYAYWLLTTVGPALDAPPVVELRPSLHSRGDSFFAEVEVTNGGEFPVEVSMLQVAVRDADSSALSFMANAGTWGGTFTVEPGTSGTRMVAMGPGPGVRKDPVVTAYVVHVNKDTYKMVDSAAVQVSIGALP